jgi:multidrug resistance efflux pump
MKRFDILTSPHEGMVAGVLLIAAIVTSGALAKRSVEPEVDTAPASNEAWSGMVRPTDPSTIAATSAITIGEVLVSVGEEVQAGQPVARHDVADRERELAALQLEIERVTREIANHESALEWHQDAIRRLLSGADAPDQLMIAEREAQQIPMRQAKDSPERAEVAYEQAARKARRLEELAAAGLVAQQDAEDALFAMRLAADDLANARRAAELATRVTAAQATQVRTARERSLADRRRQKADQQSALEQARLQLKAVQMRLDETTEAIADPFIRAPRAGVVMELLVDAGDRLPAGALVARIARLDMMAVDVDVPPLLVNALRAGGQARVDVPSAGIESRMARIQSIAPLPNEAGRYPVQLVFANPDHVRLAGQAAQVWFTHGK